jgi:hypothetical protein
MPVSSSPAALFAARPHAANRPTAVGQVAQRPGIPYRFRTRFSAAVALYHGVAGRLGQCGRVSINRRRFRRPVQSDLRGLVLRRGYRRIHLAPVWRGRRPSPAAATVAGDTTPPAGTLGENRPIVGSKFSPTGGARPRPRDQTARITAAPADVNTLSGNASTAAVQPIGSALWRAPLTQLPDRRR